MMNSFWQRNRQKVSTFAASLIFLIGLAGFVYAQVTVNILAVNATEDTKQKEIHYDLPPELTADDILDTAGLKLNYDIARGNYFVEGKVTVNSKDSKTYKIRLKDVWQIEPEDINKIKDQINNSTERLKDTEYFDFAEQKKNNLIQRLGYILEQQEKYSDNIEKRIDQFRIYSKELAKIRENAVSVSYWRTKPSTADDQNVIKFIVTVENASKDSPKTVKQKYYLPAEVKPDEHIIDTFGFGAYFDVTRGQPYLQKEEELKPGESKRYEFSIIDVWRILQQDIDNLRERTVVAYKLLKNTEYANSANYLVASIKENLEKIEYSQSQDKDIYEHISAYRKNKEFYKIAEKDVDALEDLLKALREHLERSKLKNVLQKIKSLTSVAAIAESIFKKPRKNTAWKIIAGIVIFVGIYTILHFTFWANKSKNQKKKEEEEEKEEKGENKE